MRGLKWSINEREPESYSRAVNASTAKILRTTGIGIIAASIGLLPWRILQLHHLRAQPGYSDPTDGEQAVLANYLYISVGIGIGCVFLWLASRSNSSK